MSQASLQPDLTFNVRVKTKENFMEPRDRAFACDGSCIFYIL